MANDDQSELYSRAKSFQYAFQGWWYVIRTQHNAWIHALVSLAVLILAFWLRLSTSDWAILILAIIMVWIAEFMNTAMEAIIDLYSPDIHPLAKVAKDVSAAAVMLGAFGAIIIGLLIMGPPLWERIF
ncbi:MAG: diacylglycerol kinase [Anaerolineae bacterium]|nr:MAG: diacylglycerol kinase [Anaerolineae bacterium]